MGEVIREHRAAEPVRATSLRLRIWFGCLGGALLGSAGVLGVAGAFLPASTATSPALVAVLPWVLAAAPVLAGFALATWLDRGIVGPLRAASGALGSTDPAGRRALADARAWGEIGELLEWVHALLARLDHAGREAQELRAARQRLESTLDDLMRSLERWAAAEPPVAEAGEHGAPGSLSRILERRAEREGAARARLRARLGEVASELAADLGAAREAVEHAERGFVEATALLSALRELDRLVGELAGAQAAEHGDDPAAAAARERLERYRAAAAAAIEELVAASAASVERLAGGLRHVREIADQVQVIGNRATLIALEAATRGGAAAPGKGDPLQALARDAQAATARTSELAREVDREVAAAIEAMRGLRERVAAALAEAPELPQPPVARAAVPAERLLERLRETVSDAAARGERLSAAGERASSAVERLGRRLEADARALDDLASGLEPPAREGGR